MESNHSLNFRSGAVFYLLFFVLTMFMPSRGLTGFGRIIYSVVLLHVFGGTFAVLAAKKGFGGTLCELLQIKRPEKGFWQECAKGTGFVYLGLIVTMMISYPLAKIFGIDTTGHPISEIAKTLTESWQWLVLLVLVGVVGPFVEEIIFRRFLFQAILSVKGRRYAYFGSCVIFSLIHFVPVGFLSYYLIAFILQRYMEKRENLLYPYVIHAMYNSVQVLLMFILIRYFHHA